MDSPEKPAVSSTTSNHSGFYSQKLWGFFLFSAETLGCAVCPRAGIPCSQGIPPNFYLPHMNVGPPVLLAAALQPPPSHHHTMSSPSRLPASTPPTHLDEYDFFKFLVVGLPYSLIFWQFWMFLVFRLFSILLLIVQGGKVCLPMPPS